MADPGMRKKKKNKATYNAVGFVTEGLVCFIMGSGNRFRYGSLNFYIQQREYIGFNLKVLSFLRDLSKVGFHHFFLGDLHGFISFHC